MPADGNAPLDLFTTDSFAGWGGASLGIKIATGRSPHVAINHNDVAIAMHTVNCPDTTHYCESVYDVDPVKACGGRTPDVAWFSPDCTHHSRAKGDTPKDNALRGLAGIVPTWVRAFHEAGLLPPRLIVVENVPEFEFWGPLGADGKPLKSKRGETFKAWIQELKDLGYKVDFKRLRAHLYGTPTSRERLFIIARADGFAPVWPRPSHGERGNGFGLPAFRTAADCIGWHIPALSIFATKAEAKAFAKQYHCGIPKRPLAPKTLARIAKGLQRFVIDNPKPFYMPVSHGEHRDGQGRVYDIDEPMRTVTAAHRGEYGVVEPLIASIDNQSNVDGGIHSAATPLRTATTKNRFGIVAPLLVQTGQGERASSAARPTAQEPRALDIEKPLTTIVGCGRRQALAELFLEQASEGTLPTTKAEWVAWVARNFGDRATGGWAGGERADGPLSTVTARDHHSLVATSIVKLKGSCADGQRADEPLDSVCAQGTHFAEVRAFLTKYYGTGGAANIDAPLDTATAKARFGIVTIEGNDYQIVDITFRMLTPRELARCQGFPDTYVLDVDGAGRHLTLEEQVRLVGNSVPPPVAAAIVTANVPALQQQRMAA